MGNVPAAEVVQFLVVLIPALLGVLVGAISRVIWVSRARPPAGVPPRQLVAWRLPFEVYTHPLAVAGAGVGVNVSVFVVRDRFHSDMLTCSGEKGGLLLLAWVVICSVLVVVLGLWVRSAWSREYKFKRHIVGRRIPTANWPHIWNELVGIAGDRSQWRDSVRAWLRQGCMWGLALVQLYVAWVVVSWR